MGGGYARRKAVSTSVLKHKLSQICVYEKGGKPSLFQLSFRFATELKVSMSAYPVKFGALKCALKSG